MSLPMLEIENVTKTYRLGMIGGKTLNAEIQSKIAKLRGKEDPNIKIGTDTSNYGQKFNALSNVTFNVQPGEAVGIIGHNGAGKSTLLKLISRVTAPTEGEIRLRGRVASMLEVGTGFHPELTGRENVYLNGAILGMTKKEIDKKFDEIVEFSEISKFIDTPVKRYSSGMYVKLAFAVASHLESEIMICDEVLAVGDAKFQNKCLGKMGDEANSGGRTVLYVSHNMSTIQRLCTRVIVLDHGRIIYDGDTEGGVAQYLSVNRGEITSNDLTNAERNKMCRLGAKMLKVWFPDKENNLYMQNDKLRFRLKWKTRTDLHNLVLRIYLNHVTSAPVGFSSVAMGDCKAGEENETEIELDLKGIVPGTYYFGAEFHEIDSAGSNTWHDFIQNMMTFVVLENQQLSLKGADYTNKIAWNHNAWGSVRVDSDIVDYIKK